MKWTSKFLQPKVAHHYICGLRRPSDRPAVCLFCEFIGVCKTMESYLKYTFSKQILIFAIAWMGTRDIYIALAITLLFTLIMDGFFNEDSCLCLMPKSFENYHIQLAEEKEEE